MAKRDFLRILDFSREELHAVLQRAGEMKRLEKAGESTATLPGKTLVMMFEKSSTRTRVSFEVGIQQLGGRAVFLSAADSQIGRSEPIQDTARVLSRYADLLMIRTFAHETVRSLAEHATVPVINGLCDQHHPCQILADLLTIMERQPDLSGRKLAWLGDGNNMAHSWIEAAGRLGLHLELAVPPGYEPDPAIVEEGRSAGGRIDVHHDPRAATDGADVVMTDVWTSMGQESENEQRLAVFQPFQVNAELLALAKQEAIVLHCLPAHRGEEITEEVMEGRQSAIFDQAENRLHAQKALMEFLIFQSR